MKKQPNSNYCFVCGLHNPTGLKMTFHDNGEDKVIAQHTVSSEYEGYPGVVHGGIVAAMLDEVLGRVPMIHDHDRFMLTATMEVKYRQPVPIEVPLKIVGWPIRLRGRLAQAAAEVRLPDGKIAAQGTAVLAEAPDAMVESADLEDLGWQVYENNELTKD